MPHHEPLVDAANPLYCPEVPARQYISSIRLFQASLKDATLFPYFQNLCLAMNDRPCLISSPYVKKSQFVRSFSHSPSTTKKSKKTRDARRVASKLKASSKYTAGAPGLNQRSNDDRDDDTTSDSFDDLLSRPAKRVKRSSSLTEFSFVLSKADKLRFTNSSDDNANKSQKWDTTGHTQERYWPESDQVNERIISTPKNTRSYTESFEESLYGPDLGRETPRSILSLIERLELLLPGVRIESQLNVATATHQDIVNLLGMKGHLNARVLSLFRRANIELLDLCESIEETNELNLSGSDVLKVFTRPNSFQGLRKLHLSNTILLNDDLMSLRGLASLEALFLDDTCIGNEGVMHLVALRSTLRRLILSWNDEIDNDVVPCLCALRKLEVLSLLGTSVNMNGVRKLSWTIKERGDEIDLFLPASCEEYLFRIYAEYEEDLGQGHVREPDDCDRLSVPELKENLMAHADRNPLISLEGTEDELRERLVKILTKRRENIAAFDFMIEV